MNVEEAILELDIEQKIKELAIVCGYLQQEYKKQKELIDKITEMLSQNKLNAFEKSFGKTNERTLEQAKIIIYNEILDLIKEYEEK